MAVVSVEREQDGGAAVHQGGAEQGRPEEDARRRLPAAPEGEVGPLERQGEQTMRRALLAFAYFLAAAVALAFLALPILAIFVHVPPGRLIDQLSNPVVTDALIVSFKTTLDRAGARAALRHADRVPARQPALPRPLALRHARRACRSCFHPRSPASACSRRSAASGCSARVSSAAGITIPFTQTAVTIAVAFVASPLYIRQAIAAFEAIDPNLVAASRTLGAGPARTFFRVVLPLSRGGLAAGEALAFARGLGEFGATIMFAGSLQKVTQTLPLGDLRRVRGQLRRHARDQRAARPDQRRAADLPQADLSMATLRADFTLPLRSFELELALEVDRTVALVGPSGAGKTSVLRAIAGLVRPPRGRIALGDDVWLDTDRRLFRKPDERRVGLVFQEYALFPHLTVRQNVAYAGKERADEYLERFRISHLADARPAALSGRRAPAGRARSRARPRPGSDPARRTALRARRPHQGYGARRAAGAPAASSRCRPSSSPTTSRTPRRSPTRSA